MSPTDKIKATKKRNYTKQQAIDAIHQELKKRYNPKDVLATVKEKHDVELTKLVTAMNNKGMKPRTAAAALLKKIANEDIVFDWGRM
jgi:hypothetical protein